MDETTYTSGTVENAAFEVREKALADVNAICHGYGTVEYVWSADNSSIAATRFCAHNSEHSEMVTVPVQRIASISSTHDTEGMHKYLGFMFDNAIFETQEIDGGIIPVLSGLNVLILPEKL